MLTEQIDVHFGEYIDIHIKYTYGYGYSQKHIMHCLMTFENIVQNNNKNVLMFL